MDAAKCEMCFKSYQKLDKQEDSEYRKLMLSVISNYLVSEIKINFDSSSHERPLEFCGRCLENLHLIAKLDNKINRKELQIQSSTRIFMVESLKHKIETRSRNSFPYPQLVVNDEKCIEVVRCFSCYSEFNRKQVNHNKELSFDSKLQILQHCKDHFYPNWISGTDIFNWISFSKNHYLPFCSKCFLVIEKICSLRNDKKSLIVYKKGFVDGLLASLHISRGQLKKNANQKDATVDKVKVNGSSNVPSSSDWPHIVQSYSLATRSEIENMNTRNQGGKSTLKELLENTSRNSGKRRERLWETPELQNKRSRNAAAPTLMECISESFGCVDENNNKHIQL